MAFLKESKLEFLRISVLNDLDRSLPGVVIPCCNIEMDPNKVNNFELLVCFYTSTTWVENWRFEALGKGQRPTKVSLLGRTEELNRRIPLINDL